MNLPQEVKDRLAEEIPQVLEHIDDAAQQVFNPSKVWLESMQFADYVTQLGTHLLEGHGPECVQEVAAQLVNMSNAYKMMGENALRTIDDVEDFNATHE